MDSKSDNNKSEIAYMFNQQETDKVEVAVNQMFEESGKLIPEDFTRMQLLALIQIQDCIEKLYKEGVIPDIMCVIDVALKCGFLLKDFNK